MLDFNTKHHAEHAFKLLKLKGFIVNMTGTTIYVQSKK